jgi:hypothetical protein
MKKAKPKILSLADILQPTMQNDDGVDARAGPPTSGNTRSEYDVSQSGYRNPSLQLVPDIHLMDAEGLKLLEDILEMSVDGERLELTTSENIPTVPEYVSMSDPQRRV